jgi:hypothetical protein
VPRVSSLLHDLSGGRRSPGANVPTSGLVVMTRGVRDAGSGPGGAVGGRHRDPVDQRQRSHLVAPGLTAPTRILWTCRRRRRPRSRAAIVGVPVSRRRPAAARRSLAIGRWRGAERRHGVDASERGRSQLDLRAGLIASLDRQARQRPSCPHAGRRGPTPSPAGDVGSRRIRGGPRRGDRRPWRRRAGSRPPAGVDRALDDEVGGARGGVQVSSWRASDRVASMNSSIMS